MKGKRLLDWNIWTALHYIEISLLWSSCVGKREDLEILLFFMKAMRLVEKTLTLSWDKYSVPPPSWCASLGFSLLSNTYHTLIFHCVSIFFIVCFSLLEYQSFVYRAFVLFFFLIKEVEVVILLLFQVCTTMLFLRCFVIFYHCHSHTQDPLAVPINHRMNFKILGITCKPIIGSLFHLQPEPHFSQVLNSLPKSVNFLCL